MDFCNLASLTHSTHCQNKSEREREKEKETHTYMLETQISSVPRQPYIYVTYPRSPPSQLKLLINHIPPPPALSECHVKCYLSQVHGESKQNPFCRRSTARLLDPVVLNLVQQIPGVGKVKAMALLKRFSSIHMISNVSAEELEPVVGQATAQHIWAFFHDILPWSSTT